MVATDAVVATDEGTVDEVMVDVEKPGCLIAAEDVVIPCLAVRREFLVPAAGQVQEFVPQNDGDVSESCVAAAAVAVEVVAAVVDEDMVEVGDPRLWQHQEMCTHDHQQQYHQYLTQLKQNKNLYLKDKNTQIFNAVIFH